MPWSPAVAHVRMTGATTRTPAQSPSVQVRNTRVSSSAGITSPRRSASGPNAALISATTSAQQTKATTSATRSNPPRPLVRRRKSSAPTTTATVFPTVCAATVPSGVE